MNAKAGLPANGMEMQWITRDPDSPSEPLWQGDISEKISPGVLCLVAPGRIERYPLDTDRGMNAAELEDQLEAIHLASYAWSLGCCSWKREDAEDVLQTAYLKALDGRARFDGASSFKTWLFSVIRNTAQDHRRRGHLGRLGIARFLRLGVSRQSPVQQKGSPDDRYSEEALVRCLQLLAKRQREALELVFYHDMTIEEASRVMGVSLGAARVHYERGKKRMRQLLSMTDGDPRVESVTKGTAGGGDT